MEMLAQYLGTEGARMIVGLIGVITLVSVNALFLIWMERKVAAHMQLRPGPMEVGPHGAIQTVADALKLMGKELITPDEVDKPIFWLAPIVVFLPVLLSFLVVPFSQTWIIRDMNVGIVLILAFSTLAVLSILMAGWASNNKYAVFGAIRSVAQNIAYEIPLLVTVMSIILMVGSFKLSDIVAAQSTYWFILVQPLAFILYITCATAETNRAPFDLPEAESELVAGFHTEYSGMRFALFFLAEYTNMFIVSRRGHGPVPGRLARAFPPRGGLVPAQGLRHDLPDDVVPLDLSPGALRPVDHLCLEDFDSPVVRQPAHNRPGVEALKDVPDEG